MLVNTIVENIVRKSISMLDKYRCLVMNEKSIILDGTDESCLQLVWLENGLCLQLIESTAVSEQMHWRIWRNFLNRRNHFVQEY